MYHIVMREINRQNIFYDKDDSQHFLETIECMKRENNDIFLDDTQTNNRYPWFTIENALSSI